MTDMLLIAGWCFAASLFLPLFAWALMPLLPRCAATRHLVWLALFLMLLVLPVLAWVVPPQIQLPDAMDAAPPTPVAAVHGWSMADVLYIPLPAWFAGMVFCLARLGLGLFGLQRLHAGSVRFDGMSDVRLADDGPLAFGCLRPLILLPHEAAQWPRGRLEAVLAHERAHLRRRDSLTQLLAQIVCALYWPNPLLWLSARDMRQQAEIAADNAVLAGGVRASDYAAELLQLAGQSLRLPAMAMAAPSLEARVKSVLSTEASRNGVRAMDAFKIVWLGLAAAVALALARPAIAQANGVPPPVPRAAPAPAARPLPPAPSRKPVHRHHHVSVRTHGAKLAVRQAMPQVHTAIAQGIVQIRPQVVIERQIVTQVPLVVHRAVEDARVDVKVSAALNQAETQINLAMNRASQSSPGPHIAIRLWLFGPTTPPAPAGL